jgi:cytochrome bd-type quinol oxidase subunit 2
MAEVISDQKISEQKTTKQGQHIDDHTGTIAEAFYIANLLFVGVFYLLLWGLYFLAYKNASPVSKHHLKQTLVASSISTLIVIILNIFIQLTTGYASATALILAEVYLMLIVPLFLIVGIMGFTKAVQGLDFTFPLIGKLLRKP